MTWEWKDLPNPTHPHAPNGPACTIRLTQTGWQHIFKRHVSNKREPWVEWLLSAAERLPPGTAAGVQPLQQLATAWRQGKSLKSLRDKLLQLAQSSGSQDAIIKILEQATRESFCWPLIMVTRVVQPSSTHPNLLPTSSSKSTANLPQPLDFQTMHWRAVLPVGAILVVRRVPRHKRNIVVTCYILEDYDKSPHYRWKSAVKKLLRRYVPISKDEHGRPTGWFYPKQAVTYPTGQRLCVDLVTPTNWGFNMQVQGGRWLGRLPDWPAVEQIRSAIQTSPQRFHLRPRHRPAYEDSHQQEEVRPT